MRKLVVMVAGVASVAVVVVGHAGCGTAPIAGPLCQVVVPDGGNGTPGAALACDIAWDCGSDTNFYELQCTLKGNNFECVCYTESVVGNTFTVNAFACQAADAQVSASAPTGCNWTLM